MSLHIKHLNADTSWLLVFSPASDAHDSPDPAPGSFSILLDPWLAGPSKIWSSKFSLTHHTVPSCIDSLNQIPTPDLVIVSQDKSDHCNEATLRQLDPRSKSIILGPAATTKKIRSWKHFNPQHIHTLKRYESARTQNIFRIVIPPTAPGGSAGEVTVTLVANKVDLTGLHNAIGITYRSPSSSSSQSAIPFFTNTPITPPPTPPADKTPAIPAYNHPTYTTSSLSIASPPLSQASNSISDIPPPSASGPRLNREKCVSVLYSPHGVEYSAIKPYASSHLVSEAALPLTALFHSFSRASNPWYLGGNVLMGYTNGLEIARSLLAQNMISAHDEDKECTGISTNRIKIEKFDSEAVKRHLGVGAGASSSKSSKSALTTNVVEIGSGKEYVIRGK